MGVVGVNFVASLLIYFRTLKIFVYNLVRFCNLYSLILPDKEELNLLKLLPPNTSKHIPRPPQPVRLVNDVRVIVMLSSLVSYYVDRFDSDEIHDGMNLELYYQ